MANKKYGQYTEGEIVSIISQLITTAQGSADDEISDERAQALDYYAGDMRRVMPVDEDRSAVVSRDVLDAVESMLPALIEILTDSDNALEFKAVGPEDEDAAMQETQVVRNIVFEGNNSYLNLYSFLKDALLSKTGILKVCWEEADWEREEYANLNEWELDALLNEAGVEIEVLESSINEDGTFDVALKTRKSNGEIVIYPVPPEEFGIDQNATSPNPKDANFVYHRVKKTASELIEDGYDRKIVEALPFNDTITSDEQLARYRYEDEQSYGSDNANPATRTTWITEAYLYLDIDNDGIGELQKVTLAGSSSESSNGGGTLTFLDMEATDRIPFVCATPFIRTHTFFGNSVADFILEIQEIRTLMLRSVVDNTLQANNLRTAVNEAVNLDDLMQNRPGGVVRTEGMAPPSSNIFPMPASQIPDAAYTLLEYMDDRSKQRVGSGDDVAGLGANELSNINTGVAMAALEQARQKLKLIARNIAECGLKQLFLDVHELLLKNAGNELAIKLEGEWTAVNPSEWRNRTDLKVNVGIGRTSKEYRVAMLSDTIQEQVNMLQLGLPVASPQNIFELLAKKAKMIDIDAGLAWTDPSTLPPPEPAPDPMMEQLNVQREYNANKFQVEQMQMQLEEQKFAAETLLKEEEMDVKTEVAEFKQMIEALTLEQEQEKQDHAKNMDMIDTIVEQQKLELEKYKANLTALSKFMQDNGMTLPDALQEEVIEELLEDELEDSVSEAMTGNVIVDAEISEDDKE
jgi:hypothetical protein